jgi:hypothetical protein
LRRGILQARQIEMVVGRMAPSSKGTRAWDDSSGERKTRVGRLFAREARLEMGLDLDFVVGFEGSWMLRSVGAMAVG